jgi:tripartite-type tricarboxylate transporter receptor subunit TctC
MIRPYLRLAALAAAFVAGFIDSAARLAHAQEPYPNKPITLISAFPPGGVADITARPLAQSLSKLLKQSVLVVNRQGAAGAIGNAFVAGAKPDGYTLLAALSSISTIPEADKLFERKPAYTLDQFVPIALVSADPTYLAVRTDSPWQTLGELIEAVKKKPDGYAYSSSGLYGALHVPFEMFLQQAGLKMWHVPTTGGGPAVVALLGSQVDATMGGPAALAGQVRGGKLRMLAGMGAKRHELLPEVPTMKELGLDVEYTIWIGLVAPAGTPEPIMKTLREAVAQVVRDAEFIELMKKVNTPIHYLDAPEFKTFWEADAKRLAQVVRAIGKVEEKK